MRQAQNLINQLSYLQVAINKNSHTFVDFELGKPTRTVEDSVHLVFLKIDSNPSLLLSAHDDLPCVMAHG